MWASARRPRRNRSIRSLASRSSFLTRRFPQRSRHKTSSSNAREALDSLVVTHPFHPLFGQRLPIVFERRCPVHDRLFVCECEAGAARRVTLPIRWTDRTPDDQLAHRLGPAGVAALVEVVAVLNYPPLALESRS
jgi:Family of unknown function (DUF5372)